MIPADAREALLRNWLDGAELRLYTEINGTIWREPTGYTPPRIVWVYDGDSASADHRIEFTAAGASVAGSLVVVGGALRMASPFADGPYKIRIAGDAIRVQPTVTLAIEG